MTHTPVHAMFLLLMLLCADILPLPSLPDVLQLKSGSDASEDQMVNYQFTNDAKGRMTLTQLGGTGKMTPVMTIVGKPTAASFLQVEAGDNATTAAKNETAEPAPAADSADDTAQAEKVSRSLRVTPPSRSAPAGLLVRCNAHINWHHHVISDAHSPLSYPSIHIFRTNRTLSPRLRVALRLSSMASARWLARVARKPSS